MTPPGDVTLHNVNRSHHSRFVDAGFTHALAILSLMFSPAADKRCTQCNRVPCVARWYSVIGFPFSDSSDDVLLLSDVLPAVDNDAF